MRVHKKDKDDGCVLVYDTDLLSSLTHNLSDLCHRLEMYDYKNNINNNLARALGCLDVKYLSLTDCSFEDESVFWNAIQQSNGSINTLNLFMRFNIPMLKATLQSYTTIKSIHVNIYQFQIDEYVDVCDAISVGLHLN